jgi:hypothetical protein
MIDQLPVHALITVGALTATYGGFWIAVILIAGLHRLRSTMRR